MAMIMTLILLALGGGDWAQWRGPERNGHATQFIPPLTWPAAPQEVWRVPVGAGYGGAVIGEGKVYVLSNADGSERVSCFELASGKLLWKQEWAVVYRANPAALDYGKGPFTTPLLAGKVLVTLDVTGRVQCFAASDGQPLWSHEGLGELDDERLLFCGHSGSPLQVGNAVVVHVGNERRGKMSALNLEDGRELWQWSEDLPGYASPFLAKIGAREMIVALCQNACFGLDPDTGKTLWRQPYQVEWRENIPDPVVFDDQLILTGRQPKATSALKLTRQGETWALAESWQNTSLFAYIASPLLVGRRLYGLAHTNKGQLFCLDAANGKLLWQGEGRQGMSLALLAFGAHMMTLNEHGRLRVFDISTEAAKPVADYQIEGSAFWGYPALAGRELVLREKEHLICLRF